VRLAQFAVVLSALLVFDAGAQAGLAESQGEAAPVPQCASEGPAPEATEVPPGTAGPMDPLEPPADSELPSFETVVTTPRPLGAPPPSGTYPHFLSPLRFNPLVDIQTRGRLESQGDVTLRGGMFENTGVVLGAVSLFDPQTGHYVAELPIPPSMLSETTVWTGFDNALRGFNSSVGSLAWSFRPIDSSMRLATDVGFDSANSQHAYLARRWQLGESTFLGADLDAGRAASDGELPDSDFSFERVAARAQLLTAASQSELVAGYQSKRFGWPYLYALRELHEAIGSSGAESDRMKTWLLLANHQQRLASHTRLQVTGYFRRHESDYEIDRHVPGRFNPYEHETVVWALGMLLRQEIGPVTLVGTGQVLEDALESTSLTFGRFRTRRYLKVGLAPELTWVLGKRWSLFSRAGLALDESNRDEWRLSPLFEVAARGSGGAMTQRVYLQYARATQVPGYTALGSSAVSGLFRGNPDLARERSDNFELGAQLERGDVRGGVAVFHRRDEGLVDWTYDSAVTPYAARVANHVDVKTTGVEATVAGGSTHLRWGLGYVFLFKTSDDGRVEVDSSFYALNYPRHRATASFSARLPAGLEVRSDTELRAQAPHPLRSGSPRAALSSLRLTWTPPGWTEISLWTAADNLFDSRFEQVPGVPGFGRTFALGAAVGL